MATIKDVARLSGVSVATVSRVINDSPKASDASRQAVQSAMETLNYHPNANARALASGLASDGFRVVSGGTDSHLLLVDVFAKGIRGKEAEIALDKAHITVNKNGIPVDTNPPPNPSGIRRDSPAVTTRGFRETEMSEVASCIAQVLRDPASESNLADVRRRVQGLTSRFPLYSWKQATVPA